MRACTSAGPAFGASAAPAQPAASTPTDAGNASPVARRVAAALNGEVAGKRVAILGLTFKPNTDDMRDAPSLDVAPALQEMGAVVQAFDPEGMAEAARLLGLTADTSEQVRPLLTQALRHDGPALVEVPVHRRELAMPPTITLEQMTGFGMFMAKAILNGRGDEIVDLARTNLWR